MTRKFINREMELRVLEKLKKKGFKTIVVYGRRRVGKTTLIKKFLENKNSLYFLCSRRKIEYNLRKFSEEVCKFLGIPKVEFKSFLDTFKALSSKSNVIVAIDEFGYLIEKDEGILSDFQEVIDELKGFKLILCGSAISLMESEVLGYKSPLYGRIDLQLRVKPLAFEHIFEWFREISFEDAVKLYSVTHNVPKYLEFFKAKDIELEIINNFFDNSSFLYNDAINILSEELRDYATYFQILEAISLGYTKVSEIANYSYIQPKDIFYYLKTLEKLDIIERKIPLFSKRKEKKGVYVIKDNYFNFWFRFVSPFQSDIESYSLEQPILNFKNNFNQYLGFVFESLILDLIKKKKINLNLKFTKLGKWWHRDKEIDVLALNEASKEILFAECKWKENVNAKKIVKELMEKASYVIWNNEDRKEYFAIFAKSFSKKINEFEGRKVFCFDLRDLEKAISGKRPRT